MAEVPYNAAPTAEPETRAPDDYNRVQANPSQTGGLIGQGLERLGQGATQAATNLFDIAQFYGKISVDDQINQVMTASNNIRKGDPSKTTIGPDGQPVPDTGYMGTTGRTALDQRQATMDALDKAIADGRKNLKSPQEQLEYDVQTRRLRSYWFDEIGTHADTQFKTWAADVNGVAADHALAGIASNPDDVTQMAHNASDLINARVKQAQIKYGDDPDIKKGAIALAKQEALKAQLEAIAVKDPARALTILDKNRAIAGAGYEPMANQFRQRADQQIGLGISRRSIDGATKPETAIAAKPIAGIPAGFISNIQDIEGFDPVPRWDVHQWTVGYGTRASGPNERPNTAELDQRFTNEISHAAQVVDSVNPNLDPGTKAALTSLTYNTGDAWTRSGLGEAVRSGNLAAAQKAFLQYNNVAGSPDASIAARRRREAAWFGQTEPPPVAASHASLKATAYQIAMNDPEAQDNPVALQHALTDINQRYAAAQVAADETEREKKQASDNAANGYITRLMHNDTKGIVDQIADDPSLSPQMREGLWKLAESKAGDDIDKSTEAYGKGFWGAYKGIVAPQGDDAKINDVSQLLNRAGPDGDLTLAGVQKLSEVLKQNQKSVNDQAVNTSKVGLINYAKSQLSFEADTGPVKIRDPKGEAIFNAQFIPKFEAAYDKWVKDGKDPWQFLTKENVDKIIGGMRSKAEMNADRIAATGETFPDEPKGAALPSAPQGVDPKAWAGVLSQPPVMATGQQATHQQYAAALNLLRENPTPQVKANFNKWFGAKGAMADDILKRLNPPQ